jgi:hypothetical protein
MKKIIFTHVLLLTFFLSQNIFANVCGNVVIFDSSDDDIITLPPPNYGDGIQDPEPNHTHAVGMHSVRWQVMTQSDDWIKSTPFRARLGTKQTMNIRVKAEEKEGWIQDNVCIDLYYSRDRWFSRTHDTLLQTECIGTLGPRDAKSAYFKNYSLAQLDAQKHYLFADIRYGPDHNISSRTDDTEYIEIEIIHPNNAPSVDLTPHSLSLTKTAYTGQIMGLRVGITNIGDADAYSGTRGVYQINTTTGWHTIADDGTDAAQLAAGHTAWEEISSAHGLRAPTTPGYYTYRFCADRPDYLIETDETNNCVQETLEILQSPLPDFITTSLTLTNGRTWLYPGDLYGLQVIVKNIGTITSPKGIRTSYDIKGPGTSNKWTRVADDGSDAHELTPGRSQFEYISDGHGARIPNTPGLYDARACADHQNVVKEEDEANNCSYVRFEVKSRPAPNLIPTYVGIKGGLRVHHKKKFNPEFRVHNRGDRDANSSIRSSYYISGPGTGNQWQRVDGDGSDRNQLKRGGSAFERINGGVYTPGKKKGWHQLMVCVDTHKQVSESNENDNCKSISFYAH